MIRGTTICGVRRNGPDAISGDGQVTVGETAIMKMNAKKVPRIAGGKVVIALRSVGGRRLRAERKV